MKNLLNNLPPFYVGQKIVSLINASNLGIKKGDEFEVKRIQKACCKDYDYLVDIGIFVKHHYSQCHKCNTTFDKTGVIWLNRKLFAPLQQQKFPLIKLSQIKENEKIKIEEFEKQILIEN